MGRLIGSLHYSGIAPAQPWRSSSASVSMCGPRYMMAVRLHSGRGRERSSIADQGSGSRVCRLKRRSQVGGSRGEAGSEEILPRTYVRPVREPKIIDARKQGGRLNYA